MTKRNAGRQIDKAASKSRPKKSSSATKTQPEITMRKRNPGKQTDKTDSSARPRKSSSRTKTRVTPAPQIDLLSYTSQTAEASLEVVRLDDNETALILFTTAIEKIDLHYCHKAEIRGYVPCNREGCVLCRIGRKIDTRLLTPVYLPASQTVAILPVGKSLRPGALLPQLGNVLKSTKPMVMFVKRDAGKYTVATRELTDDIDAGEVVIQKFTTAYDAGKITLTSVYSRIANEELENVPDIARLLALKG